MISRWPGATHENKIFNISEVYQRFEYNQIGGVLLADHNYNTRSFVMTPIDSPRTANEWRYNEAHRATYTVPDAIELWKRRFKCLQNVINNAEGMRIEDRNAQSNRLYLIWIHFLSRMHANYNCCVCSFA